MQAAEAGILLPCFTARDMEIVLRLGALSPERVEVLVNGDSLAAVDLGMADTELVMRIPRALLFRGDNVITLRRNGRSGRGPRLMALTIRPL